MVRRYYIVSKYQILPLYACSRSLVQDRSALLSAPTLPNLERRYRRKSRRQRLISRQRSIEEQLLELATAYLKWKAGLRKSHTLEQPSNVDCPPPQASAESSYYTIADACGFLCKYLH